MKIGFIGQGFVGKNIANDFESRGYEIVRYSLEPAYRENKDAIQSCDVVFIAVPTPTTPQGFDYSIVESMLSLVGEGKIVIIKSTLLPGTTKKLQEQNPNLVIFFSPEFLSEATASHDASHPMFNIVGMASASAGHRTVAEMIIGILPKSEHSFIVTSDSAELFKYTHNVHGYIRVVFANLMYDTAQALNVDWSQVERIMNIDPMMSPYYNSPVHQSGRGAGGNCFIKDMSAFLGLFSELRPDDALGIEVFRAIEKKNLELLTLTNKNQDLVKGVYGDNKANSS